MVFNLSIGFVIGIIFSIIWVKVVLILYNFEKPLPKKSIFRKYHVHYSILGLIFLLLSLLVTSNVNTSAFMWGLAIAIIVKHASEDDGFVFITKNK